MILVTSDAHRGLVYAIAAVPGASWRHCHTRSFRNLQDQVSKVAQPWQPDAGAVCAQMARLEIPADCRRVAATDATTMIETVPPALAA